MLPDRVSNPGPLTYESGALPIALRGCTVKSIDFMRRNMLTPNVKVEICQHAPT